MHINKSLHGRILIFKDSRNSLTLIKVFIMKQLAHIVASFVFLVLYTVSANAQYDFQVGGLYYKLTSVETCSVAKTYTEDFTKNSNGTVSPNKSSYSGDIVIPSHVQYGNRNLKVTAIDDTAFFGSSITSVKIERGGVQQIGRSAFNDCQQLRVVEIGEGVTSIGNGAFYGCRNLEVLRLPENGLKTIGSEAFEDCGTPTGQIRIAPSCTDIGWNAFRFKSQVGSTFVFIPSTSKINIYENALPIYGKSIYVGRDLSLNSAYIYCFEDVQFGPNVTKMPKYSVPQYANGKKVQRLVIGSRIKSVPRIDSRDLKIIEVGSSDPPQAEGFPDNVYLDAVLYVPEGCIPKYQNAEIWKNFWTIKER